MRLPLPMKRLWAKPMAFSVLVNSVGAKDIYCLYSAAFEKPVQSILDLTVEHYITFSLHFFGLDILLLLSTSILLLYHCPFSPKPFLPG